MGRYDLAATLGVVETKTAISDYLAKGLTDDSKKAVMEVCERELIESDTPNPYGSSEGRSSIDEQVEFFEVPPHDLQAVEAWARLRCRGNSVEKLAAAFNVENDLEAVVGHIAEGLPPRSRDAVKAICRAELGQTDPKAS